ncbi:MAG TPA: hypothetical protein VFA83_16600 [Acidimicrobiales bacterium]|nr:hypothetical protein [Acidimicrobiales bacterium]
MSTPEDRLRRAAQARAAGVPEPPDRWDDVEQGAARTRRSDRLRVTGVVVIGLAAAVVAGVLFVPKLMHEPPDTIAAGPGAATSTTVASATTVTTGAPAPFPYQPLWPFRSVAEAQQWQSGAAGPRDPWHLDAAQTAIQFSADFLGYTDIDTVTSKAEGADGAHIGVGFSTEGTSRGTAAIVHLARVGSGSDAPWEVVGTDDHDLTLTAPAYGASVTSPITVAGTITGVDESLHVQVRQPTFPALVGDKCCLPAGGQNTPWQTTVDVKGNTDQILTIAVSTGGHLKTVERFAVTGVRVG